MYISFYDIGIFILFLTAIVVGVCLMGVLYRVYTVVGQASTFFGERKTEIEKTILLLPETLESVNALVVSLKQTVDQTNGAITTVHHDVTDTIDDLKDGLETFTLYAKIIADIVRAVFSKS